MKSLPLSDTIKTYTTEGEVMKMVDISQEPISWGELALLTHETQVARFNWCSCEDNDGNENPYEDCPV